MFLCLCSCLAIPTIVSFFYAYVYAAYADVRAYLTSQQT